ncbi:MAG: tryptophan--tRNA ligase [Chlamydiales bacterium]
MKQNQEVVLTGDRPTGPLHLGHYVGSLRNRLAFQGKAKQFIMIADVQALTDHFRNPAEIEKNTLEVMYDYLAIGLDPKKSTIFIQSLIPELFEFTVYFLNLVTWNRLQHNPTVKLELQQKAFTGVPAGFMIYPVSQAADILAFKPTLVPVGADQRPMMEQTWEIREAIHSLYNTNLFPKPKALIPQMSRLPGIDGKSKMSKSLKNSIFLGEPRDTLQKKIKQMYTDPGHIRVEDPGKVEGNPVFTYLDEFGTDKSQIQSFKEYYQRGGLGDSKVKQYLFEVLEEWIAPIRARREEFAKNPDGVRRILHEGSEKAREVACSTLKEFRRAMQFIA